MSQVPRAETTAVAPMRQSAAAANITRLIIVLVLPCEAPATIRRREFHNADTIPQRSRIENNISVMSNGTKPVERSDYSTA